MLIQIGKVDFVDNVPTQGIEITASGGTSVRLDLHRQTSVPYRITYRIRNVKEEAWDDYSDAYADYKTVDGIQTPMHVTRYLNGDRIGKPSGIPPNTTKTIPPTTSPPSKAGASVIMKRWSQREQIIQDSQHHDFMRAPGRPIGNGR